jgi:hypothetical protein
MDRVKIVGTLLQLTLHFKPMLNRRWAAIKNVTVPAGTWYE